MDLFTPVRDEALGADAYLIDTDRCARPFRPETRAFLLLAGRHGVRILGAALAHAPHGDLELL